MLVISRNVRIPLEVLEFSAIRAQGAGGQNVNKVSSAIHLRFDIKASSLPLFYQQQLLTSNDQRINKDGILILKAQQFRSQDKNKADALQRLQKIIQQAGVVQKKRRPTKPTKGSQKRRLDGKNHRAKTKAMRGKVSY